jgi:hypothetical protein
MGLLDKQELADLGRLLREEREGRQVAEREVARLQGRADGLERQTTQLLESLAQERESHQRTLERHQTLVTQIVEMKREGFVPAPVANPGQLDQVGPNLPDAVLAAIEQRSHGVPELERKLAKYAMAALREQGADAEKVAMAILIGGSPPATDDDDLEDL